MTLKLDFAGPDWIEQARVVLDALVAEHGEDGKTFSMCEMFSGAPMGIAASGTAAWHFYIDGRAVRVGTGEAEDTDARIRADYEATLPDARLVYTSEILAERAQQPADGSTVQVEGDMSAMPPYLIEFHNRMALITA